MSGFLTGIKVVSLTHFLQGPTCAQFLADLGADVVKVERIGGAFERHVSNLNAFLGEGESLFFLMTGRNQRSIELDLASADGKAVLWRLLEEADVLIENFRPGVLDKLGFSYEAVQARRPDLVYCSLSGYGSTGPDKNKPGQDLLIQAHSGLVTLSGTAEGPPIPVGSTIVDQHSGTLGALGIIAALFGRTRSGQGVRVDANLFSAALHLQIEPFSCHLNGYQLYPKSETGVSTRFHAAPYGSFQASDGWLILSRTEGPALAAAFGDETFRRWSPNDQYTYREEINSLIASHLKNNTVKHWVRVFDENKIWYSLIRDYEEIEADPQLAANQAVLEFETQRAGKVRVLNHPIQYDGAVPGLRRPPPSLGADTAEVLREIGFSDSAIGDLSTRKSIGPLT